MVKKRPKIKKLLELGLELCSLYKNVYTYKSYKHAVTFLQGQSAAPLSPLPLNNWSEEERAWKKFVTVVPSTASWTKTEYMSLLSVVYIFVQCMSTGIIRNIPSAPADEGLRTLKMHCLL